MIGLGDPVCVVLASVLHFYPAPRAREIVGSWVSRLAAGSAVVISCLRNDDPGLFEQAAGSYTAARVHNYTREELESLFGGLELMPPGVTLAHAWRGGMTTTPHKPPGAAYMLGGVALKRPVSG